MKSMIWGLVLLFVLLVFAVTYKGAIAATPSPGRCPIPEGRPTLADPSGGKAIGCAYGCGDEVNQIGHLDEFYHEYYALDFPGNLFPVFAAQSGKLTRFDESGAKVLWISHGLDWYTKYAHLSSINASLLNTEVSKGEIIGWSGNTGLFGTGPHLHFELRNGDGRAQTTNNGWSYPVPELYAPGGWIDICGEGGETGTKSLVRSEFTVERTNPTLSEEVWFSTELTNDGEVTIYLRNVFLRLKRGDLDHNVYGLTVNQGTVILLPGESKLFDLRAPPLPEAGLWRIDKVEAEDTSGTWFEMGGIGSHLMAGYQNLIKDHPASASSVRAGSGNGPQKANDGNMRTRWESEYSDPQSIEFDLDYEQWVDTIIVRSEFAYPKWFNVYVQEQGKSTWAEVVKDVPGIQSNSNYISFAARKARKIKFVFTERGTGWGNSIWEIEVYNTAPIGGPMFTPTPTVTPQPTNTPTPANTPDTTPPEEVTLTSPVTGEYLGTGWFNTTANATDFGSGVKKVEFHFWHDDGWEVVEDWTGVDGWSASFNATGLTTQNDMKLLVWAVDNAGNRVQSNVATTLSNIVPDCDLVWVSKPGSINSGTVEITANYNGWWRATIDGNPWTTLLVENGSAIAQVDLAIDSGKSVTHIIALWFPHEGGANYCATDITVDNRPDPTSTNTPTRTSTSTSVPTVTRTPTSTATPTKTLVPTVVSSSTSTPTVVPTQTPTPSPEGEPTATRTPTVVPSATSTSTPTASNTPTPTMTPAPSCSIVWVANSGSKNVGVKYPKI